MRLALLSLVCLFLSNATWALEASPAAGKAAAAAAALKRDSARCNAHADIDACYDAIRWNPDDPALLVALGDALARAQRPADALRNYRRAAALAPNVRGVAAKISAAEAKLAAGRTRGIPPVDRLSSNASPPKHFSNAAPATQSH